jgi:uncharacterized protein YndB with AHSA1/START domain
MAVERKKPRDSDLVITRVFDAPRDLVFKVWTEPKHVLHWWGPAGFDSPVIEIDLRPGGKFLYCMRGPDGKRYWNKGVFHEVIPSEKITSSIYFSDEKGNTVDPSYYGMDEFPAEMRDVVTFETVAGNKTRLTIHRNHALSIAEKYGEVQGWNQSLDKFAKELAIAGGTSHSSDCEFTLTRVFSAKREQVWEVWTDPKHIGVWYGPRGFTITTHSMDLRTGGSWSHTMHGPDGVDYHNKTRYLEVEKHSKLVYDHGGSDDRPPLFRVTVFFSEVAGGTRMDMTMRFPSPEAAKETRKYIKKAGGEGTWDRLAEYLEKKGSGKEKFIINRSFEAPVERMFEMWTDPKHFSQWLPPTGFGMEFIKSDIRTGGTSLYFMTGGNGAKWYGKAEYLEIAKPERVVYTQQFCDENGKVSRHPMSPTWPQTMLTTVHLTPEGPDRTRVTVTWEPHGATTREELETFIKAKGGMTQGWTGSFDKLDELLAKR